MWLDLELDFVVTFVVSVIMKQLDEYVKEHGLKSEYCGIYSIRHYRPVVLQTLNEMKVLFNNCK